MPTILRWLLNLGPTNPIAVRLVQNGSRRPRHMYIRSIYLAVLILVLLWSLLTIGAGSLDYRLLAARASQSFMFVAYLQIVLICVLAPVFMAGAIAQEANPRTWDILLTTPLSGPQIVLGNLLGRLLFILALLFCSLPLFALTQYFGGVPGRSIFASYLIAGVAAVVVGAVAITLSVNRLAGRRAVFTFYIAVVTYLAITIAIDAGVRTNGGGALNGNGVTLMTAVNPFLALRALLEPTGYPRGPVGATGIGGLILAHPVTAFCMIGSLLSVILVAGSTITVRTGGMGMIASSSVSVPWYRRAFGLGAAGSGHRQPRWVGGNPIAWREAAARNSTLSKVLARWLFIAVGAVFGVILSVLYVTGTFTPATFRLALMATILAEIAVVTLAALNMSATAISREREDGTLDLILTTPITPSTYLTGKMRGLVAYLLPMIAVPVWTLGVASVMVLLGGFGADVELSTRISGKAITEPLVLPEAPILAAVTMVPFVAFCVMIGLHWSIKSKGAISSVVGAVAVVGVIASVIGACGYKSALDLSIVGPALAGLSPGSLALALIEPADAMLSTVAGAGLGQARVSLAIGCAIGAAVYTAIGYAIHSSLVRGFDTTTRKLAGTN